MFLAFPKSPPVYSVEFNLFLSHTQRIPFIVATSPLLFWPRITIFNSLPLYTLQDPELKTDVKITARLDVFVVSKCPYSRNDAFYKASIGQDFQASVAATYELSFFAMFLSSVLTWHPLTSAWVDRCVTFIGEQVPVLVSCNRYASIGEQTIRSPSSASLFSPNATPPTFSPPRRHRSTRSTHFPRTWWWSLIGSGKSDCEQN